MTEMSARTLARIESVAVLRRKGRSTRQIALRLGVSVRTVQRITKLADARERTNQRHIPETAGTWQSRAACKGMPEETFFLPWYHTHRPDVKAAKAICVGCPVLEECRTYALTRAWETSDGIWAGMTPSERRTARGGYRYERTPA